LKLATLSAVARTRFAPFFCQWQHLGYFIIMSNPHGLSDGRAVTHDPYVPALDGLRGLAAILVAGAHYMIMEDGAPLSEIVQTLTGLGMTLFFVFSGFHYNYNATFIRPGGLLFRVS
jgi:hypothetical protein